MIVDYHPLKIRGSPEPVSLTWLFICSLCSIFNEI